MKKMLYKNRTSNDKSKKEFFLEEHIKREHFWVRKVKRCTYHIKPESGNVTTRDVVSKLAILQKTDPRKVKDLSITRIHNSKSQEETILMKVSGMFFIDHNNTLFAIHYEKAYEVYLTRREKEPKKSA